MKRELFRFCDICKSFYGTAVLRNVDLSLYQGEILGLVGENGAGKSTLIEIICGILTPDSGNIFRKELPVSIRNPMQARKQGIHFVLQEPSIVPNMTVAENIFLYDSGSGNRKMPGQEELYQQSRELLDRLGVCIDARTPAFKLSLSEKFMLNLAMAVSGPSSILVLDEITSVLNKKELAAVMRIMEEYKSQGGAVLFTSHSIEEVVLAADRIEVLRDGEVAGILRKKDFNKETIVKLMTENRQTVPPELLRKQPGPDFFRIENGQCGRIRDLNFSIRFGEIVGITGMIGSGKSTIAKITFGMEKITEGRICIKGIAQKHYSIACAIRNGILYIPEERRAFGVFDNLSIGDNIAVSSLERVSTAGVLNHRMQNYLTNFYCSRVKLKDRKGKLSSVELSGGNQQKMILARCMAAKPDLLIVDEVTNGLDIASKAEVCSLLSEMADSGTAILLISTNYRELAGLCSRVLIMRDGRIHHELLGDEITEERIISDIWMFE